MVSLTKGKWETPAPGVRHNVGPVGGAGGCVEAQGRAWLVIFNNIIFKVIILLLISRHTI